MRKTDRVRRSRQTGEGVRKKQKREGEKEIDREKERQMGGRAEREGEKNHV